ncbi:hypothetical protein IQ215_06345 [Cyanobacterium stanieri LEGE 03274]|uniref:Uncharacterized protein n=2 Tax=Cyanobacterium TaxID=102234 RepID=A0ABR9V346_9CHRO|nr:hypothetical protein [Cyanobacterium stanieri LEGE 03274]
MYQKIHCVNHVGKNLLIVGYHPDKAWEFKVVTQEGKTVREVSEFDDAKVAEYHGKKWIEDNLLRD